MAKTPVRHLLSLVAFCLISSAAATYYVPSPCPPPPSPRPPPPSPCPSPSPYPPPPSPRPPPPSPCPSPPPYPPPPSPSPPPPPPSTCSCDGVPGTCVISRYDPTDYTKGIVCSDTCYKEKCGYPACGYVPEGKTAYCCFNSSALCTDDGHGNQCATGAGAPGLCFCIKGLASNAQCRSVSIAGVTLTNKGGCEENTCNAVFKDSFCCDRPGVDSVNTVCTGNGDPKGGMGRKKLLLK